MANQSKYRAIKHSRWGGDEEVYTNSLEQVYEWLHDDMIDYDVFDTFSNERISSSDIHRDEFGNFTNSKDKAGEDAERILRERANEEIERRNEKVLQQQAKREAEAISKKNKAKEEARKAREIQKQREAEEKFKQEQAKKAEEARVAKEQARLEKRVKKKTQKKVRVKPRVIEDKDKGNRSGDTALEELETQFVKSNKIKYHTNDSDACTISCSLSINKDFLKQWKRALGIIFFTKSIKLPAATVFHHLVSDFTPYDEMREQKIQKKISSNVRSKYKTYYKKNRPNPRQMKEYRVKALEKLVAQERETKGVRRQNLYGTYRKHTIDDVTIDANGITWHSPYAGYIYSPDNNKNFQQTHPFNEIHATRGPEWIDRAINSSEFNQKFYEIMENAIAEYINDDRYEGKELMDVIRNKGYDQNK